MNNAMKKLIEGNFRLTKPRLAVMECLEKMKRPASVREIHKKIGCFDQASAYRTIKLLESLGIVMAESVGAEKLFCLASKPHHHIVCRLCGHIENIPCKHKFKKIKNFTDIDHQLTLQGICHKCKK